MLTIIEANGEVPHDSLYNLSRAYMYSYYSQGVEFNVALQQAGLFARFLRDEIVSGRNRDYLIGLEDGIPHLSDERYSPDLIGVRLFVKADLVAKRGRFFKQICDRFHRGEPIEVDNLINEVMRSLLSYLRRRRVVTRFPEYRQEVLAKNS